MSQAKNFCYLVNKNIAPDNEWFDGEDEIAQMAYSGVAYKQGATIVKQTVLFSDGSAARMEGVGVRELS
jgi:hypothetical protein